jgi:molybdopterin-containing oxidoreductase family molybdopterin binding subunit
MKRVGERGGGKWQRITWDEALDTIAARLKEIGDKYGTTSLAWVLAMFDIVAGSSLIGLAGACQGTFIDVTGCGDAAGPCADTVSYGSPWWYGEDYTTHFHSPALCLIWGENCTDTEPFKWHKIRDAKEKGARLVVIDPRFTTTASKADEYVAIRPGTDAALALGMMNVILDRGLQDSTFIADHTVGPLLVRSDNGFLLKEKDIKADGSDKYVVWDTNASAPQSYDTPQAAPALNGAYRVNGVDCNPAFQLLSDLIQQYPPDKASEITEIPADTITRLAIEYATRKPAASFRGMGCTRGSFYGDISFRAINTLAAITGNISFEGRMVFEVNRGPLMSHGVPSFITLLRFYEAVLTEKPYPIKALCTTRHNLMNQDPNFNRITREMVPRLEFIVASDMFMNTSACYADIVLPGCSHFEYSDLDQPVGVGAHNYLMFHPKIIEPPYECRPELDVATDVARRMGIEGFLGQTQEEYIEQVLASGHPSMKGVTMEKLGEGPVLPATYSLPDFNTPSGKLEFYTERLKDFGQELPVYLEPRESARTPLAQKYPLSLTTAHPKYRYHSMFANISWIRELDKEPVVEMNPADAQARGIRDGDLVRVFNDRGEVSIKAIVHQGVRPGLANIYQGWWPEHYVAGTHQALTDNVINPAQEAIYEPNAALFDTLVQIEQIKEG